MQQHWEMARQVGFYAVAPHQGKHPKIKRPSDLFKLPIDDKLKRSRGNNIKLSRVRRIKQKDGAD